MPLYRVSLSRTVREYANFTMEADNEEEAREGAMELADGAWTPAEVRDEEIDIEPSDPDEEE